jgi:hypothetical protein
LLAACSFCFVVPAISPPIPAHRSTVFRNARELESAATPHRSRPLTHRQRCLCLFFFPTPANPRRWPEEDQESPLFSPLFNHFALNVLSLTNCSGIIGNS